MRFRLVKTGRSYVDRTEPIPGVYEETATDSAYSQLNSPTDAVDAITEDESLLPVAWTELLPFASETTGGIPAASHSEVYSCLVKWAGDDTDRWQRLHKALLRIQHPVWEKRNGRDELVSWAAANLRFHQARAELERFRKMRPPLEPRDSDAKKAREADMSFWGRLAERQALRARVALAEDAEAAAVLMAIATEYVQEVTGSGANGGASSGD